MKAYYAVIIPEETQFSVLFPDLIDCRSCGETIEEACFSAVNALSEFLRALAEDGSPIPEPSTRLEARVKLDEIFDELNIQLTSVDYQFQLIPVHETNHYSTSSISPPVSANPGPRN
jgi:predicted RNase H-like HicB family nuclease